MSPPVECRLCGKKLKEPRRLRCGSCNTRIRRYRTKLAAIELLGGKCGDCGWSGHPAAFHFHHKNDKAFSMGQRMNQKWEVVKKELKKCRLLCVRCHVIEHAAAENDPIWEELEMYKGRLFD